MIDRASSKKYFTLLDNYNIYDTDQLGMRV